MRRLNLRSDWMPTRGGKGRTRPRPAAVGGATGAEHDHSVDPLLQSAPAFEFDQRLSW